MNIAFTPPDLAPPGAAGVFFTDDKSLQGVLGASDFATRVGLNQQSQTECQKYGCAIIQFDVPSPPQAQVPIAAPGAKQQGITVGGAREWLTQGNVQIADTMVVVYTDTTSSGPRDFDLPL
ncbi:MAG: hypothetical protein A2253_02515 [Deltaproteobacteria bacterium RIFOXYA2_FULL_55_11]|nr:MAG: hypothetical protein A2253_02515 [Deltaproteobacteria bacterium RIFOXYA2_FULL_55_11]